MNRDWELVTSMQLKHSHFYCLNRFFFWGGGGGGGEGRSGGKVELGGLGRGDKESDGKAITNLNMFMCAQFQRMMSNSPYNYYVRNFLTCAILCEDV